MTRPFVLGIDCRLYVMKPDTRNPATPVPAQWDGTNWNAIKDDFSQMKTTRDVTLSLTTATADVTSRASNGWRQLVSALKEANIDANIIWQPDNELFGELLDAYIEQCPIAVLVLDGPKDEWSASEDNEVKRCGADGKITGLYADVIVTEFSRGEPIEDAATADVTLQPALGMIYPQWITLPEVAP